MLPKYYHFSIFIGWGLLSFIETKLLSFRNIRGLLSMKLMSTRIKIGVDKVKSIILCEGFIVSKAQEGKAKPKSGAKKSRLNMQICYS